MDEKERDISFDETDTSAIALQAEGDVIAGK